MSSIVDARGAADLFFGMVYGLMKARLQQLHGGKFSEVFPDADGFGSCPSDGSHATITQVGYA